MFQLFISLTLDFFYLHYSTRAFCPPVISFWILLSYFPEINEPKEICGEGRGAVENKMGAPVKIKQDGRTGNINSLCPTVRLRPLIPSGRIIFLVPIFILFIFLFLFCFSFYLFSTASPEKEIFNFLFITGPKGATLIILFSPRL